MKKKLILFVFIFFIYCNDTPYEMNYTLINIAENDKNTTMEWGDIFREYAFVLSIAFKKQKTLFNKTLKELESTVQELIDLSKTEISAPVPLGGISYCKKKCFDFLSSVLKYVTSPWKSDEFWNKYISINETHQEIMLPYFLNKLLQTEPYLLFSPLAENLNSLPEGSSNARIIHLKDKMTIDIKTLKELDATSKEKQLIKEALQIITNKEHGAFPSLFQKELKEKFMTLISKLEIETGISYSIIFGQLLGTCADLGVLLLEKIEPGIYLAENLTDLIETLDQIDKALHYISILENLFGTFIAMGLENPEIIQDINAPSIKASFQQTFQKLEELKQAINTGRE